MLIPILGDLDLVDLGHTSITESRFGFEVSGGASRETRAPKEEGSYES